MAVDIHSEIAKKHGVSKALAASVYTHVFVFAARKIADSEDERDILIPYFGRIRVKRRFLGRKKEKVEQNEKETLLRKEGRKSIQDSSMRARLRENHEED